MKEIVKALQIQQSYSNFAEKEYWKIISIEIKTKAFKK